MYDAEERKKYVNEWLQARADQGLSAWTVQLEAKALGKLYGINPEDENYFNPPKRNREDIKRSRGDRVRDKHFSVTNNDELIKFCKGTGLRRSELGMLKGGDLVTKEEIEREIAAIESVPVQERTPAEEKRLGVLQDTRLFDCCYYIHVRNGKGGRERVSPIVGKMRRRSSSASEIRRATRRSGSTSTRALTSTATAPNMQPTSTAPMQGPSKKSPTTGSTRERGVNFRVMSTPAGKMNPGKAGQESHANL